MISIKNLKKNLVIIIIIITIIITIISPTRTPGIFNSTPKLITIDTRTFPGYYYHSYSE